MDVVKERIISKFVNEAPFVFWYLGTGIGGLHYYSKGIFFRLEMNKQIGGMDAFCDQLILHYDWCFAKKQWVFTNLCEFQVRAA